ncbi:putative ubiquinol-cytochrome C reductase iron-sulfur subunit [Mycobacterium xenopi 3993]|nr:putative ubiquinol-cytochrome C reductase iron-sulfur subunit [Mycobacterium xenopi 3993]
MTDIGDQARTDADRHQEPDEAALAAMSREELVALGGRLDGVETVYKQPRWPVQGTRAEKRAERQVALWLLAGGFFGLALLLVFLFWPWEYKPKEASGSFLYSLTTPLYGLTFGLSIMSIAVGAVLFQKKFIPEEISIQERHDNRSPEIHRKTVAANLTDALESSTLRRRKMIGLSLGIGLGAFGVGTLVAFVGGLIKNPWKPVVQTAQGKKAVLWTSGWTPRYPGETIYLARATGRHAGRRLSRCARKTLTPAAWKRSFRGGNPTVTAPPRNHTKSCWPSRWASAIR